MREGGRERVKEGEVVRKGGREGREGRGGGGAERGGTDI